MNNTKKPKDLNYKYKLAVGLNYSEQENLAPFMNIKAERLKADEIVMLAKKHNVPIIENSALAKALSALDLDQEIPEELYEAIALLLFEIEQKGA